MRYESERKGWITNDRLEALFALYGEGSLDAKSLLWRIYENYTTVRGRAPELTGLYAIIHQMNTEKTVLVLRMELIFEDALISDYPPRQRRTMRKSPRGQKFNRLSRELYSSKGI